MPYILVRSKLNLQDPRKTFDTAPVLAGDVNSMCLTFIDFQDTEELGFAINKVISEKLTRSEKIKQHEHSKKYETYQCKYPPHVVLNELEIHAGYQVVAASSIGETIVWTLHSVPRRAETESNR